MQEATINHFSVQGFSELNSVTWERSSTLTKLLTIATVCNKAKFTFAEEQCKCPVAVVLCVLCTFALKCKMCYEMLNVPRIAALAEQMLCCGYFNTSGHCI